MSEYKFIAYEVENGRARIVLNRPEKRNALSIALLEEMQEALWDADDRKDVHAVVIKGAGSCFSSGYDLDPNARAALPDGTHRQIGRAHV